MNTRTVWEYQVQGKHGMENFSGWFTSVHAAKSWFFRNYKFWAQRGYRLVMNTRVIETGFTGFRIHYNHHKA